MQCLNYRGEIKPNNSNHLYSEVFDRIERDNTVIGSTVRGFMELMYGEWASSVPESKTSALEPFWNNGYFGSSDARAAYAAVSYFRPNVIIEVGSGNSTKFFRKAITERSPATKIVSVDPMPRSEIKLLVDEVVPGRVQDVNPSIFAMLDKNDVLFWDGSHVCFNGSDILCLFSRCASTDKARRHRAHS